MGMRRLVADTMPSVTLKSSPKGAPIATAFCPTARLSESSTARLILRLIRLVTMPSRSGGEPTSEW